MLIPGPGCDAGFSRGGLAVVAGAEGAAGAEVGWGTAGSRCQRKRLRMDCCKAAVGWAIAGNCCRRKRLKAGCCRVAVAAGASMVEVVGSPGWKAG